MSILDAIILAIIEGLTEFLPVSSTGHMIIGSSVMGIESDNFTKLFTIAIQLGAILSVVVLYFKRFFKSFNFYYKLIVAFIPAAIMGLLLSDVIDSLLENPLAVAISLLVGGIILLFVDKWFRKPVIKEEEDIDFVTAFKIGLFQCIAMIPGVSRSGASIVGGMSQKMSRQLAAEFSFFLAVPTMFAATGKKLLDYFNDGNTINVEQMKILAIGNIVAFIIALIAIKSFIGYLNKNGFKLFGYYRIILGLVLIILLLSGYDLKIV
ncbi:MAG: undecaprenyl-diphosphate phosphatase [Flavobacteriia bacterium]|nr:undecaprenyl-diphosphate phosphatase [Flavobacteriia bacterium]